LVAQRGVTQETEIFAQSLRWLQGGKVPIFLERRRFEKGKKNWTTGISRLSRNHGCGGGSSFSGGIKKISSHSETREAWSGLEKVPRPGRRGNARGCQKKKASSLPRIREGNSERAVAEHGDSPLYGGAGSARTKRKEKFVQKKVGPAQALKPGIPRGKSHRAKAFLTARRTGRLPIEKGEILHPARKKEGHHKETTQRWTPVTSDKATTTTYSS